MKVNTRSPAYVAAFAAIVPAILTAAIMTLHVATADRVRRNEQLLRKKALLELFAADLGVADASALSDDAVADLVDRRIDTSRTLRDPQTGLELPLATAYRTDIRADATPAKSDVLGHAIPFSGNGFWGPIEGLLGLSPDLERATGLVLLRQTETPGLGGRIEERSFREQFMKLRVSRPAGGGKFIYIGGAAAAGPSDPRFGRTVQAITGATQTCLALERLLNESLERFHRAAAASGLTEVPSAPGRPGG